jgi:group II intron reverse transcriptase/maturase
MQDSSLLQQATEFQVLKLAWESIEDNSGIPGVDRVSLKRFRWNWEERLVNLASEVRSHNYRPMKLRKRWIPKRDRREKRELQIPAVRDRVIQRAVLEVLYPIFEPMFLDCSFGYRPGIGLQDAVNRILIIRENGWWWVLDADIDDFFNQVSHDLLVRFLEDDLPDQSLMQLIEGWLSVVGKDKGIPMGSPISPLFANVVLHRLDQHITAARFQVVRYADDFLVFARNQEELTFAYELAARGLSDLQLAYEPTKTRQTCFDLGFTFIGVNFFGDCYEYIWEDKRIEVHGNEADPLFSRYGPNY